MKLTKKVIKAWQECREVLERERHFTEVEKARRLHYLEKAERRYEKVYGVPFNIVIYTERLRR